MKLLKRKYCTCSIKRQGSLYFKDICHPILITILINMQTKSQILIDEFTFAMVYKGVSLDRMSYLRNFV